MGEAWHEAAHPDTSRYQRAKREERPNSLDRQVRELGFKSESVSPKYDPRERTIGTGKRTARGERPLLRFGEKRFVMKMFIYKSRPRRNPRFDHENLAAFTQAPGGLSEKSLKIGYMVQNVSKYNSPQ